MDIPGNTPVSQGLNVRIFLGISVEKRKKNGAGLSKRSTEYSSKSQGYPPLIPASAVFLFFSQIFLEISLG